MSEVAKSTISISKAVQVCISNNYTFAAYRKPHAEAKELIVQEVAQVNRLNGVHDISNLRGFLVAPFNETTCCESIIIKADKRFSGTICESDFKNLKSQVHPYSNGNLCVKPSVVEKQAYVSEIENIVQEIKNGEFEKAVLSRVKIINGEYISKLTDVFDMLCHSYPNAFVYLFRSGAQMWLGATPEPLLCSTNGNANTASVAGTKRYSHEMTDLRAWNKKERLEQEYVTLYIKRVLADFKIDDYQETGPYAKKAGNLLHLRTDFEFAINKVKDRLGELMYSLHPTSAVCGMPKKKTLEYILNHETHSREYYSGFLGPVGLDNSNSLFVNLRCMKVLPDCLALYIGGGITIDSNPEDEWLETEIKAETLLSILNQFK